MLYTYINKLSSYTINGTTKLKLPNTTVQEGVKQQRDITLLTKVHIVKAMVFPIVVYACESWTIKKVEHCGIHAFKQCGAGGFFESPLNSKEVKPVNPKGNSP